MWNGLRRGGPDAGLPERSRSRVSGVEKFHTFSHSHINDAVECRHCSPRTYGRTDQFGISDTLSGRMLMGLPASAFFPSGP